MDDIIKYARSGIYIILVLALVVAGFTSVYRLNSGEQAAVLRFGELTTVVTTPGIKFKLPFGIEQVEKVNVDEIKSIQYGYRTLSEGGTQSAPTYSDHSEERIMLTYGAYLVEVEAVLQYRISDIEKFLYRIADPVGTLRLATETILRRNVQNKSLDNALVEKDAIQMETLPELREKIAQYDMGVRIIDLQIQNIAVPSAVADAYADVNNAKNQLAEMLDRAQRYYNETIPSARADAYQRVRAAEGYRAEKVAIAMGDAERFLSILEEYEEAKDITKTRLYIEMMERVLATVNSKYIFDMAPGSDILKFFPIETNR